MILGLRGFPGLLKDLAELAMDFPFQRGMVQGLVFVPLYAVLVMPDFAEVRWNQQGMVVEIAEFLWAQKWIVPDFAEVLWDLYWKA